MAKRREKTSKTKTEESRPLTLNDLAHFTIKAIAPKLNQALELCGVFTHLKGVRLSEDTDGTVGFLYVSRKDSIYLLRKAFHAVSETATAWPPPNNLLREGTSFPYVDYYWTPKQISFALEPARNWRRTKFRPEDLVRYRDPKVPGWWKSHVASVLRSEGATNIHIIKNGWNHEHCNLCRAEIGRDGDPYAYYSKSDHDWLCQSCYKRFIARHDLRFLQFEK